MRSKINELHYNMMLLPGMVFLILFHFIPMLGSVIALQNFVPAEGIFHSKWVGFDNFTYMFQLPDSSQIFKNTIIIAVAKIIANIIVPLTFALLLNELRISSYKRIVQTMVYLPHFLSWVILSGVLINLLSLHGVINQILSLFGIRSINFLISNFWFRPIVVISSTWKDFGFNSIIYLAALMGISPAIYESSVIDGANRWQQLKYVSIPGIKATIVLLATLSLGQVLNAGFDQIFNLYNPLVYSTGDIIDTYVYRIGMVQAQYGLATAVGLLKSLISFILIIFSNKLAAKFANYRIF